MKANKLLGTLMMGVGMAGAAHAAEILVTTNISVSTTWTSNNTYNLQSQIYVLPGATLTIQAGTIVASDTNIGGSLAVCKGAQIFVQGTQSNPVIMTSKADLATWTGGNPKTGTWREAANEWGNLTIMGAAYISENIIGTNTPTPNASNFANMEGLTNGPSTDRYGGGNDDDDSGTVTYLSLRYGGKVIGLNNELNGLSLGGIGRGTDINHVEIMNNVDDGIEIWGGTVNLKYVNIWNVGDDSFDIDQGWRGKAQFGLIVQGYSVDAVQGSGVGDNCFETDGAEDSDWQPVTTGTIYNFTVIGQPIDGDQGTAWRDNARLQYRNCIFMELGEELVKFDNIDNDGAHGYGFNNTLSWASTWTTNYNAVPPHVNDPANPALFYTAQTSGKLAEITDSVFFHNPFGAAYTEATARGVFDAGNNNVLIAGSNPADAPIQAITRGSPVVKGTKTMVPVLSLDPRPANEALTSVAAAPNDGFFTPAQYRGAFVPGGQSWLCGWTASNAFGFTTACDPMVSFCFPGQGGIIPCPCGQTAVAGGGCANFAPPSAGTGATLSAVGIASLAGDTVVFSSANEHSSGTVTSILLQGTTSLAAGTPYAAGVRCPAGTLKRLYKGNAVAATFVRPNGTDPTPVHTRSAALGNPILAGQTRYYMAYYRDSGAAGPCGNPASTYNSTQSGAVIWGP